jgi:hypothetical protein
MRSGFEQRLVTNSSCHSRGFSTAQERALLGFSLMFFRRDCPQDDGPHHQARSHEKEEIGFGKSRH